jgi:hypothetical protein
MRRQIAPTQPAQIDDAAQAARGGRSGQVGCRPSVDVLEVGALHRVHQVIGSVHPFQCAGQRLPVEHVGRDDVDLGPPRVRPERSRAPRHRSYRVPPFEEQRDEATTHVATGAEDDDLHVATCGPVPGGSSEKVTLQPYGRQW